MKPDQPQYHAFISYSHADKAVAAWLHRALKGYRIPAKLVGSKTAVGIVPARLAPIFRDRDELSAAGSLSAALQAALRSSRFLILIASPSAVASRWVNEEVLQFKRIHGEDRVLVLIASGNPDATDGSDCFPAALRYQLAADGTISDIRTEPIAADIRPGKDGRKLALLKIAAGMTGLKLDALVQRDLARRQRRLALLAAGAMALALIMTVLAVLALRARAEADRQRAQSDGLVEFMLTDLRKKLEPVGRLDVLDAVGQKAMAYYGAQNLAGLDADALGRRARALHLVGEVRDLRGDSAGALNAFTEAATSTAELLARAPDDPDQIFDHAQSAYWVGYIAYQRKDLPTAEARFRDYDRLAAALVKSDPANPKWRQEQAYAHNNLGTLYLDASRYDEAANRFRRGQAIEERLAAAAPGDSQHQWLLAQGHAWIAKALTGASQFAAASDEYRRELAIYDKVLAADTRHARARESRAVTQTGLARLALLQGDAAGAADLAGAAFATITALSSTDPSNRSWQETALFVAVLHGEALMAAQRWDAAAQSNRWALAKATELVALDPTVASWRRSGIMPARWMQMALLVHAGDRAAARLASERFHRDFAGDRGKEPQGWSSWAMVLTLDALEARARHDAATAQVRFAQARHSLPPLPTERDLALARYLDSALGVTGTAAPTDLRYDPRPLLSVAASTKTERR